MPQRPPPSRLSNQSSYFHDGQHRSSRLSNQFQSDGENSLPSLSNQSPYFHDGESSLPRSHTSMSYGTTERTVSRSARPVRPSTASGRKSRNGTASILGETESQSIVCAISEARGVSPTVGVAFINVTLGEVTLSQICDNQTYVKTINKIQMVSPSRILFMTTASSPTPSTLYSLVERLVADKQIISLDRSTWSETEGLDYINTLALEENIDPLKVSTNGKFYAIGSFAAAMTFIRRYFSINFAPRSLRISYQPSDDTMMIDIAAIQALEIMQNLRNPKSKDSLFGLLNQTCTPMGSRLLRSNILQPTTRAEEILEPRYDALEELTNNEEMFREIRKALKLFHDVESLLTKLIIVPTSDDVQVFEEQINHVLMMKSFLEAIPELYAALQPATSELLTKIRNLCHPERQRDILDMIRNTIEPDVTYVKSALDLRNQRTFAVKAGIDGMLDVCRQTYKELTEEVHKYVDELNEQHRLAAVLKFDNGRKYWLSLPASDDRSLPLINIVRKKDKIECQTLSLVKLNMRISDACTDVLVQSDDVVHNLIKDLRGEVSGLFQVCESVALVDMIASFVELATTRDYVRPDLTGTLALKAARHPVLDRTIDNLIPNDYYATNQYCFHIVTGCNMSGKSTYIRGVALLQIMAQIGSFVPAEYGAFPIIHTLFARVSLEDNIESNLSTFSVEMREMAFILRNIDHKSLAVIDELGRATSTRDGLAIALAMSEALIHKKASVWFATHFTDLTRILADRPGILNLHLASTSTTRDGLPHITMLYQATSGALAGDEHYGINLAKAIGLPRLFIEKAETISKDLRQKRNASKRSSESAMQVHRRDLVLRLQGTLEQVRDSGSEEALPGYLRRLQVEFINGMENIIR